MDQLTYNLEQLVGSLNTAFLSDLSSFNLSRTMFLEVHRYYLTT